MLILCSRDLLRRDRRQHGQRLRCVYNGDVLAHDRAFDLHSLSGGNLLRWDWGELGQRLCVVLGRNLLLHQWSLCLYLLHSRHLLGGHRRHHQCFLHSLLSRDIFWRDRGHHSINLHPLQRWQILLSHRRHGVRHVRQLRCWLLLWSGGVAMPAVPGRDSRWGGGSVGVRALCGRDVRGWSWDDHVHWMSCRHLPRDHWGVHVWFLRALWGWDVFCHARSHFNFILYHLSSRDLLG